MIFLPAVTPWTDTICYCSAQCNTLHSEWGKLCAWVKVQTLLSLPVEISGEESSPQPFL